MDVIRGFKIFTLINTSKHNLAEEYYEVYKSTAFLLVVNSII